MGYAVYEDAFARDYGVRRWAGYAVPAECDVEDCHERIDRGMGYRCEKIWNYEESKEDEDSPDYDPEYDGEEIEGCNLHFCSAHEQHSLFHENVEPKPDILEWRRWQITAPSWSRWREENPSEVEKIILELNGGDSSKERILLLHTREEGGVQMIGGNSILLADGNKDQAEIQKYLDAGWVIAETHMPPFEDPRTEELVEMVKEQWYEVQDDV